METSSGTDRTITRFVTIRPIYGNMSRLEGELANTFADNRQIL